MALKHWRLDIAHWPGPDRVRWHIDRDLVEPSPNGRFACVLYSCFEIRLNTDVGLLMLLAGPPESPTGLFQPREFTGLDFAPSPSMQWLNGSRYVAATAYLYDSRRNRVDRLALTFLRDLTWEPWRSRTAFMSFFRRLFGRW